MSGNILASISLNAYFGGLWNSFDTGKIIRKGPEKKLTDKRDELWCYNILVSRTGSSSSGKKK